MLMRSLTVPPAGLWILLPLSSFSEWIFFCLFCFVEHISNNQHYFLLFTILSFLCSYIFLVNVAEYSLYIFCISVLESGCSDFIRKQQQSVFQLCFFAERLPSQITVLFKASDNIPLSWGTEPSAYRLSASHFIRPPFNYRTGHKPVFPHHTPCTLRPSFNDEKSAPGVSTFVVVSFFYYYYSPHFYFLGFCLCVMEVCVCVCQRGDFVHN